MKTYFGMDIPPLDSIAMTGIYFPFMLLTIFIVWMGWWKEDEEDEDDLFEEEV